MLGFVRYLIEHTPLSTALGYTPKQSPKQSPKPLGAKRPKTEVDHAALRAAEIKRMKRAAKALESVKKKGGA